MYYINFHTHHKQKSGSIDVMQISVFDNETHFKSGIYSIGIHPAAIQTNPIDTLSLFEKAKNSNICFIGEAGLDRMIDIPLQHQIDVFLQQIEVSENRNKPLIIHCVRAFPELIRLKKESKPHMPWIIHGFNNRLEMAEELLRHGFLFSFGHALINDRSNAAKVIHHIPITSFFLETDDANVSIQEIYKQVSIYRNMDLSTLLNKLYEHFKLLVPANQLILCIQEQLC